MINEKDYDIKFMIRSDMIRPTIAAESVRMVLTYMQTLFGDVLLEAPKEITDALKGGEAK